MNSIVILSLFFTVFKILELAMVAYRCTYDYYKYLIVYECACTIISDLILLIFKCYKLQRTHSIVICMDISAQCSYSYPNQNFLLLLNNHWIIRYAQNNIATILCYLSDACASAMRSLNVTPFNLGTMQMCGAKAWDSITKNLTHSRI